MRSKVPIPSLWQDLAADDIDIPFAVVLKLRRKRVGGEKRGNNVDRVAAVMLGDDIEHFQLGRCVQSIPGFDLGGRSAACEHSVKPLGAVLHECLRRRFSRFSDGRDDAASALKDLKIIGTLDLHLEFIESVARIYDMRVRVDKPRTRNSPARVDLSFRAKGRRNVLRPAESRNIAADHRDTCIFYYPEV